MASTYSDLKIELIATGEQSGTWGTTTNINLGTALEEAIVASADVSFAGADVTVTLTDSNATQTARHLRLNCTGTTGGARNLILGSGCQIQKPYLINNTCADTITVKNTTGTGIAVPAGKSMWVYNDGTNVVDAVTHLSSLTLGAALPVASGGTGLTSGTSGGVLAFTASGTLASSGALAANNLVIGGGAGVAPSTTTTGSGILTFLGTPSSANLAAAVTDETGTGALVFANSPSLTTPSLGAATATSVNKLTITAPATGATLTVADGATLATSGAYASTLTFTGATNVTFPTSGTLATTGGSVASIDFGTTGLTPNTATTGAVTVAGTLAVANGGTGITSFGTGVATWLGTPSSANLAAAVTDETGTGSLVFATSPTLTTPNLGTPSAATLTNATGLPLSTGVTGTLGVSNGGTGQTTYTDGQLLIGNTTGNTLTKATLTQGSGITITNGAGAITIAANNSGTVTSVGQTFTGGLISVSGSPITSSGTLALTVAGTSGGIPYFSSASTWASSAALTANALVIGGGAGVAPSTTTTGTGVLTALGTAVGSAGAFTTNNATNTFTAAQTFRAANAIRSEAASTQDAVVIAGRAGGTSSYAATITPTTLTASRTITLPNADINFTTGLGVANGGTGTTTLTANNVILGNGTSAVQFVAPGTNGNVLTSNGTTWSSSAPAVTLAGNNAFTGANTFYNGTGQTFGTATSTQDGIILAGRSGGTLSYRATITPTTLTASRTLTLPDVSGTFLTTGTAVTVAQGGTGATTLTANNVILGNGTSAVQFVAPGTNGNVLTSNGTTWTSAALTSLTGQTDSATPFETSLGSGAGSSNTGVNNTFIGYQAGNGVTSGTDNVALGYQALTIGVGATENVAIGSKALDSGSGCSRNVAVGYQALQAVTTASYNTAAGWFSLYSNTANQNTAFGYYTGANNSTGTDNTYIGYFTGSATYSGGTAITTGTNNTLIGAGADANSASATNQIVIGSKLVGVGDSSVTIGSNAGKIYNYYTVNATWTQTSDGTMKNIVGPDTLGLSFIKRLNPIKYTWKPRNELPQDHPYYNPVNPVDTTTVIHGFVAQEVKAALDAEGCDTFNGWDQGSDGIQAISREMFISPLVKAVQELAAQVEALQAEIALLKAQP